MFSPNELIRAVWAHPPQSFSNKPVHPGWWQIAISLLREGGVLNSREAPRSWRWTALILAVLYQSLWCVALIWLMYTRFLMFPLGAPGEGDGNNTSAIEVTWIDEVRPHTAQTLPTPLPEPLPAPLPTPLPEPLPTPQSEPAPAERPASPLMLTEVNTPEEDAFTLSAPRLQRPQTAPLIPDQPPPAQREITLTEVPLLQRPEQHLPSFGQPRPVDLPTPELTVQAREIPAPLPELTLHPHPATTRPVDLPTRTREISEREIPAPLPEIELHPPSPAEFPPPALPARAREIAEREIALTPPAAEALREIDLTPPSQPRMPPASSSDAWEQATRTDAGSGLLDEQGRPHLAGHSARTGGGLPPGTIVEDYANIDRMGTWLKRPVPGYQPGPLDQIWVPHENILEEWVRRSIKNIWIPLPGTDKVIRCTVVLLMLGGGCGITDPNLLDIEAGARPPPDIPFKAELHEDQDSLRSGPENQGPPPASEEMQ